MIKIPVLFENEHCIAVDKPPGILSIPGRTQIEPKVSKPKLALNETLAQQIGTHLFTVHRLDFEVSGLILFAKTSLAHKILSVDFENRKISKTYEAWTPHASIELGSKLLWEDKILRGKKRAYLSPHGKTAITHAFPENEIHFGGSLGLKWKLQPVTGRAHQLRFHLYQFQLPILGDTLYGSTITFLPQTIALRAVKLEVNNPETAKKLNLPPFFNATEISAYFSHQL